MKQGVLGQKVLGMVSTNTWFFMNKDTSEMVIVDPADQAERIIQQVTAMEGTPVAILLTHGHFDHILAVEKVKTQYNIPVYVFETEQALLKDPQSNLSGSWGESFSTKADMELKDGEKVILAGFEIKVLHTPGHTAGSCCYYLPEEELLFSGDTLFAQSVGRTDFPTSNTRNMKESLDKLLTELPDNTLVCPGHGEETTIGYEKRYNPFA